MGVAPECGIAAVKILDREGRGNSGDVLGGLQWVMDNRERYNIRIINLSIGTVDVGSRDPLVKAVEAAWDMGVVVVTAAGNSGPGAQTITSPGISRKVITTGASDDHKSTTIWGGTLINFSGRGPTGECIIKPDVLAPGTDIVSCMTCTGITDERKKVLRMVNGNYAVMSGTSMSTPIISGAVALLIQKYPGITPDEVKYRIKSSATSLNYPQNQQG